MGLDTWNKDRVRNRAKERPKCSYANSVSGASELKEKSGQSPLKYGKKESSQESRNSKSEVACESENRKYHPSSTRKKTQLNNLDYSKEIQVKPYERSPHRRDSRKFEKEKKTETRHRTEKNEEPRRSKRTKDDGSLKILELSDGKRSSDAGRKEKRSSDYRESKYGSKDLKPSKSENSTRNKPDREINDKNKSCEKSKVDSNQKDLKLSFMETLNLTLSPVKKTSANTQHVASIAPIMECEVEGDLVIGCSQLCITENHAETVCPGKTDLSHSELVLMANTTKDLNTGDCKLVSQSGPVADKIVCINKQAPNLEVDENSELLAKLTVADKLIVCAVKDTIICEEADKHSLVEDSEVIDLSSFIEIDRVSGSPSSETPNVSMPAEQIEGDGSMLERSEDADNKTFKLKSNLTETPKGIRESPYTELVNVSIKGIENKHCFYDENSIDFNFLRCIPKLISPLQSPVRPKALHTLERTAKAPVVNTLYKELLPETDIKSTYLSVSEELNKENCQPDKSDCGIKTALVASDDEVEEGEILSEDEQICKQTPQTRSSPSQLVPDHVTSVTKKQTGQDSELPLSKGDILIIPPEKSKTKPKAKIHTRPKLSAFPTTTQRKLSADSCLDGILEIVTPSSIEDILQMLRIIRKHIRKKYMKFKILFSLRQFHRIIEAATLWFISLVRGLDWSSLCSLPEILQKKLCKHIETRFQKLKKNGIVDRIFEVHLVNMKTSLWNFVEEQLDSLFDTLKAVILKLCDKAKIEKKTTTCANTSKSNPVKSSQNKRRKRINTSLTSESVPCLRQLEFHSQSKMSNSKIQNNNGVQKERVKKLTGIDFNSENVDLSSSNVSSSSKLPNLSPAKTSTSTELGPKSQPNSAGLSFNLVSDDHMGDVFKTLLNDSDNLLPDTLPESMWILGTPEQTVSSSHEFNNVTSPYGKKIPTEDPFSWSPIAPRNFQTVLNPDVFDESCLLEVPTSASSSKILNDSDQLKSILMEDLAVSLTVPSPLKSDSHLSFLRPCDTEPILEVDVKCCEGSVLDEEDATEQEIHLTLDSDNSSIGSLEDTGESVRFQYHPSEPMQAVVMEKSNDHFIVKIRRAVTSSSPAGDCLLEGTGAATPESLSTVEGNKLEMEIRLDTNLEECIDRLLLQPDHLESANVTENSIIGLKRPKRVPLTVQENESVFKLPPNRSQNLVSTAENKTADVDHSEINCENVTNCIEETCNQVPPVEKLPLKTSDAHSVDSNLKKQKRKSLDEEPSPKRRKNLPPAEKDQGTKHNKMGTSHLEKSSKKKHKRAVGDCAINVHCSKVSPTSLSAKNVIKKRGEVIVSWTRDEDRAILIECQKTGPRKKTFLSLSSTMNKYPHQVEERFRQLMKLFKKSRDSSS
ncbi:hypothetical protein GDO78_001256 [Eleutherodactylus coqui]|uniref:CASP8-associated protein 2 n=1 Tax=Eleutherodactylus coqui TaxID=57060 RepID=A0A8J6FSF9_ELECQ|nr:hypothetical protein GDO78_001256 [Eleutherodactylus coqui]